MLGSLASSSALFCSASFLSFRRFSDKALAVASVTAVFLRSSSSFLINSWFSGESCFVFSNLFSNLFNKAFSSTMFAFNSCFARACKLSTSDKILALASGPPSSNFF
jgi:hypothetical protein